MSSFSFENHKMWIFSQIYSFIITFLFNSDFVCFCLSGQDTLEKNILTSVRLPCLNKGDIKIKCCKMTTISSEKFVLKNMFSVYN